ncbi:hypothetical protein SO802_032420 [Lithocarpus litseifolius]|uniref:Uncharacterized protein n=1 Tax=Lithocarpus litseifolius TaxID=425828 RepID=A0AAW2BRR9_9ROSI
MRAELPSCTVPEAPTPTSVAFQSDQEVERQTVDIYSLGQFSPVNNVGREGDEEVDNVFSELLSICDKKGCNSQTG